MSKFNAGVYLILVFATFLFLYCFSIAETVSEYKAVGFYGLLIVVNGYLWRWVAKEEK